MVSSLLVHLMAAYIRLLGCTSTVSWYGEENVPPPPFIYAFWHNRLLFLVHTHRNRGIKVLISKSKDGELIASVIHKFGFGSIRGSSSRAAREATLQMVRALRDNGVCGITPDGPKGPACQVKDGLSYIAHRTGAPIVPIAYSAKRKKILGSWDGFLFPLPFNKVAVVVGKPIAVTTDDDLGETNRRISAALNGVAAAADRLAII